MEAFSDEVYRSCRGPTKLMGCALLWPSLNNLVSVAAGKERHGLLVGGGGRAQSCTVCSSDREHRAPSCPRAPQRMVRVTVLLWCSPLEEGLRFYLKTGFYHYKNESLKTTLLGKGYRRQPQQGRDPRRAESRMLVAEKLLTLLSLGQLEAPGPGKICQLPCN